MLLLRSMSMGERAADCAFAATGSVTRCRKATISVADRCMARERELRGVVGGVADREEGRQAFLFNSLDGLTRHEAAIEIQRDFPRLANSLGWKSDTKNPASVAAHGGVQKGLGQHSRPTAPYRADPFVATPEASR